MSHKIKSLILKRGRIFAFLRMQRTVWQIVGIFASAKSLLTANFLYVDNISLFNIMVRRGGL